MKKITLFVTVLLVIVGQILFAQKPIDSKGRVIDSKGNIYVGGTKLGSVSKDSIVKNAQGKKIAFLKSGGVLVDVKGRTIGKMGKDGQTFYNANGTSVLQLKDNADSETCDILDSNGKVIGNVYQNYKGMACTIHCFSNQLDPKTHKKGKK